MARPFVYINMAMTADGKITSAAREYPRFTSARDREEMDRLRAEADAMLLGAGTARSDDPSWEVRSASMREHRRALGKPAGLTRVLVTASARLDAASRFFDDTDGSDRIIATVEAAPAERLAPLEGRAEIWRCGRERVDLSELLHRLGARGVGRVLCEGGAELNWGLVEADLVDEFHVTLAPALLGGSEAPTPVGGRGLAMAGARRLRLEEVRRLGDELFCRFSVVR